MYEHNDQSRRVLEMLPKAAQTDLANSPALQDWFIAFCNGDVQGGYAVAYVESLGYEVTEKGK